MRTRARSLVVALLVSACGASLGGCGAEEGEEVLAAARQRVQREAKRLALRHVRLVGPELNWATLAIEEIHARNPEGGREALEQAAEGDLRAACAVLERLATEQEEVGSRQSAVELQRCRAVLGLLSEEDWALPAFEAALQHGAGGPEDWLWLADHSPYYGSSGSRAGYLTVALEFAQESRDPVAEARALLGQCVERLEWISFGAPDLQGSEAEARRAEARELLRGYLVKEPSDYRAARLFVLASLPDRHGLSPEGLEELRQHLRSEGVISLALRGHPDSTIDSDALRCIRALPCKDVEFVEQLELAAVVEAAIESSQSVVPLDRLDASAGLGQSVNRPRWLSCLVDASLQLKLEPTGRALAGRMACADWGKLHAMTGPSAQVSLQRGNALLALAAALFELGQDQRAIAELTRARTFAKQPGHARWFRAWSINALPERWSRLARLWRHELYLDHAASTSRFAVSRDYEIETIALQRR